MATSLTIGLIGLTACGNGDSEVVVETSAGDVTKEAFYEELKNKHGSEVLTQMVTMTVLADKYEVTDKQVDAELESIKEQVGENFEQTLAAQNLTEEDLRQDIKNGLLQEAAVTEGIEVSDDEIKSYFENQKYEIEAQHILVADEELAKKVMKEIKDGKDFGELAEKYSTDEQSATNKGELPPFTVGDMVPEFDKAVFAMKVDEISEPVKSDFGFHIIKLNGKKELDEDFGKLEDNKEEIRREIASKKIDQTEAMEKIGKMMDETKIKVNIDQFKDLFDTPEPEEQETEPKE